jgi:hypothetical protein
MGITIKERGWAGHFICADRCLYRRNTLISDGTYQVVVSSVGNMVRLDSNGNSTETLLEIGCDRVYETMTFFAVEENGYIETDVTKEIYLNCNRGLSKSELRDDMDNQADEMHEENVQKVVQLMESGDIVVIYRESYED